MHEKEGAGSVGALRGALAESGLSCEGSLLISGDAGDRNLEPAEDGWIGDGNLTVRRNNGGQCTLGHVEDRAQVGAPGTGVNIEQQRPRGVGCVGHVFESTSHPGDQVRIDGAHRDSTVRHVGPVLRLVLGDPQRFRSAEIRIEAKTRAVGNECFVPLATKAITQRGGTSVLPHDRFAG